MSVTHSKDLGPRATDIIGRVERAPLTGRLRPGSWLAHLALEKEVTPAGVDAISEAIARRRSASVSSSNSGRAEPEAVTGQIYGETPDAAGRSFGADLPYRRPADHMERSVPRGDQEEWIDYD